MHANLNAIDDLFALPFVCTNIHATKENRFSIKPNEKITTINSAVENFDFIETKYYRSLFDKQKNFQNSVIIEIFIDDGTIFHKGKNTKLR